MVAMTVRLSTEVREAVRRDAFYRDIPMNSIVEVLIRAHYGLSLTETQKEILVEINPN